MNPERIYLACPYSHPDPAVREARFQEANKAAGILLQRGHIVFSPISHSHPIALRADLPKDYHFWSTLDESFIEWCDEVWVLAIPGWLESNGVKRERAYAEKCGKAVWLWSGIPIFDARQELVWEF